MQKCLELELYSWVEDLLFCHSLKVLPCLGCLPSQRMYTYFNTRNFKLKFCKNQYQVINLSEAGAFKEPDLHSLNLGSKIRIFEILFSKHFILLDHYIFKDSWQNI